MTNTGTSASTDSVKTMRDEGVSLLFLSGNTICWVTPLRPSEDGQPNRIMFRGGPYGGDHTFATRREKEHGPFPERGPDEGYLLGARNVDPVTGGGDWAITKPDHWMFAGTGVKKGDSIPGLIGWEFHGDPPTDLKGLEIVAEGTAWSGGVNPSTGPPPSTPARRATSSSTPPPSSGARASPLPPATCCPGPTSPTPTAPIPAFKRSPRTCSTAPSRAIPILRVKTRNKTRAGGMATSAWPCLVGGVSRHAHAAVGMPRYAFHGNEPDFNAIEEILSLCVDANEISRSGRSCPGDFLNSVISGPVPEPETAARSADPQPSPDRPWTPSEENARRGSAEPPRELPGPELGVP